MTYDPKEREQLEADIAERAAMIERQAMEQRCKVETKRYYDRTPDHDNIIVTRSAPATRRDQAMTYDTAGWQRYIAREIDRTSKGWLEASMAAVAEVLAEERKRVAEEHAKMWAEFAAEIASLRIELLESQLAEARGLPKRSLKVVPDKAMIG